MREYYYETVYILKPTLSEEETEKSIENINKTIEKHGGKVLKINKWGKRQLAYQINDYDRGYYVLTNIFTNDRDFVKRLENDFKLNENIIRYLSFKLKPSQIKELKAELTKQQEKPEKPEETLNGES